MTGETRKKTVISSHWPLFAALNMDVSAIEEKLYFEMLGLSFCSKFD